MSFIDDVWQQIKTVQTGFDSWVSKNMSRESQNVIFCTSEEREKGWLLTSKLIFSELGMVNERFFANKNIGKANNSKPSESKEYFSRCKEVLP